MEINFATMCKDVTHERSLIILLSLTDSDILKQLEFTDHEIHIKIILPLKSYIDREC